MEKLKMALMAIPTIEFQKAGSSADISALQSMGSTLKGTISLLMNKTCILNFLNEFRELFDQGIIVPLAVKRLKFVGRLWTWSTNHSLGKHAEVRARGPKNAL